MAEAEACQLYSWRHLLCPRFFKAPTLAFPLLLPVSHLLDTLVMRHETWDIALPTTTTSSSPPLSFLFPLFFLSFFVPSWSRSVHYWSSLKCSTSNTTTVQVDVFHCPLHKHTHRHMHTHKQRQSYWMEQLPGRLGHVSIMRKNWQISSKTAVLTREQGVQIKVAVCQVLG